MGKFEKGNTIGNRFKANAEQTEIAKRGGIASGEARRRVRSLKEALDILLNKEFKDENGEMKYGYELDRKSVV